MRLYGKALMLAAAVMLSVMGAYVLLSKTSGEEAPIVEAMVSPGDRGEEVARIQKRLKELGHYEGEISGIYDVLTSEAVKQFQEERGIDPSGRCSAETRYLLGLPVSAEELTVYERRRFLAATLDAVCPEAPYLVRVALGGMILRRCETEGFPNDVTSVVFADPHLSEALTHDYAKEPSSQSWAAVTDAEAGLSPCPEALYYANRSQTTDAYFGYPVAYKNGKHIFFSE